MRRSGPLLVAVDFSEFSMAALSWAAREARVHDASLIVLHVVHDPDDAPGTYRKNGGSPSERMEDAAARLLDEFLDSVRTSAPHLDDVADLSTRIVVGVPATRIVEVAGKVGATHIVMGSHGRTGWTHMLIGSKAEKVVRLSPIPVTIVKRAQDAEERAR